MSHQRHAKIGALGNDRRRKHGVSSVMCGIEHLSKDLTSWLKQIVSISTNANSDTHVIYQCQRWLVKRNIQLAGHTPSGLFSSVHANRAYMHRQNAMSMIYAGEPRKWLIYATSQTRSPNVYESVSGPILTASLNYHRHKQCKLYASVFASSTEGKASARCSVENGIFDLQGFQFLPRCMECRRGLTMRFRSVRLSVRLSNACIVPKRKKDMFRFFYTIWKIIYPIFLRRRMVGRERPLLP